MRLSLFRVLFLTIILLAAILRLWQLGAVPPSPNWDEVSLGYNAYSILQTGKDEYGRFLPVVLRSYDDYKPALYTYLTIPSVSIFGLNTFSTRLPSAVMGVIAVIATFFLVNELLRDQELKYKEWIPTLAAFFMAISPWSIQFSRVAYESNSGVTLNILFALFFLKGLRNSTFLILSAIFAGLAIYAYQSEKVFVPALALLLVLLFWKKIISINKKYLSFSVLAGLIVILPMLSFIYTNKAALLRVTGTSIFSYKSEYLPAYVNRLNQDKSKDDYIGVILENRRIVYAKKIIANYLTHFDPGFLFLGVGDIQRHHAPNVGIIYLFEIPLILAGVYYLAFGKLDRSIKFFIFGWLLLAPVPASVTVQDPQAVRTLNFLPTWQILSAIGLLWVYQVSAPLRFKKILAGGFAVFALVNFLFYLNMYFVALNPRFGYQWQYGWKQAVDQASMIGGNYQTIQVTDDEPLEKSYMFFLFYLKYPPLEYQKIGQNSSGGFEEHHYFDKFVFRKIDWRKDSENRNTLFIGKPNEIPKQNVIKTIYNLDGTPAIIIGKS